MKIGLLEVKVGKQPGDLNLIERFLSEDVDVLVAPEFFLSGFNIMNFTDILGILEKIRLTCVGKLQNKLIIPGTMLYKTFRNSDKEIVNACPVFKKDDYILYFKESESGEQALAQNINCNYLRGYSGRNNFLFRGKRFALEICRDQGRQKIPEDTDIEVVISYDNRAGVYLAPNAKDRKRNIFLCDGQIPVTAGYFYNFSDAEKFKRLNPIKTNGNLSIYEIK